MTDGIVMPSPSEEKNRKLLADLALCSGVALISVGITSVVAAVVIYTVDRNESIESKTEDYSVAVDKQVFHVGCRLYC